MAAAVAATKTVAATATAAALNKSVGITRCSCQVVSLRLPARRAATRPSRTVKKERWEMRAAIAADPLTPPRSQPRRRVGRGPWVDGVTTRDLPTRSAEGAVSVAPESRGSGACGCSAAGRGLKALGWGAASGSDRWSSPGLSEVCVFAGSQVLGIRRGAGLLGVPNPGEDAAPTPVPGDLLGKGLLKPASFI